jgi:hypothetical protein
MGWEVELTCMGLITLKTNPPESTLPFYYMRTQQEGII